MRIKFQQASLKLVETKVYRVWATTIDSENAFALTMCLMRKFHIMVVKTRVIRLRVTQTGGPNMSDQIAFCAFHSFLVEIQMNPGYICVTHANIK